MPDICFKLVPSNPKGTSSRKLLYPGQEVSTYLPEARCSECGCSFDPPAIPFAKPVIDAAIEKGELGGDLKSFAGFFLDPPYRWGLSSFTLDEFQPFAVWLRRNLSLPDGYPILPSARIVPLPIRWKTTDLPPVIVENFDDTLILVSQKTSEAIQTLDLGDVRISPTIDVKNRLNAPMLELSVGNMATTDATDEQIYEAWMNDQDEDRIPPEWLRCKTCGHLLRGEYTLDPRHIHSRHEIFRLEEFSGIYLTERGRDLLQSVSDAFAFQEISVSPPTEFLAT